jgi:hypothetical protein
MKGSLIILLSLFSFLLSSGQATAQFGPIETAIAAGYGGRKVGEIIDQFKQTGVSLIQQAEDTGNALLSRAANEANVLARNIDFRLGEQIDRTFDRLDDQEKLLIIQAEIIRRQLARMSDKAYDAKDTLMVDLNYLADRLPFVNEGFFLQSVRGIAYFPGGSDYQMKVFASTLGVQDGVRTRVTLTIDGQPVENLSVDQSRQRGQALITIPYSVLAPYFKERELALVPANLRFEVERKSGWWIFESTRSEGPFDVPLSLSLYPRLAATATVSAKVNQYAWKRVESRSQSKGTPDRHCSRRCRGEPTRGPNRIEMTIEGGNVDIEGYKRFAKPAELRCTGGGNACAFFGAIVTSITGNGTKAVATWDTWSRPTTWTLTVPVEQYSHVGEKDWTSVPHDIRFGHPFYWDFPKASSVRLIRIRSFTKKEYSLLVGSEDPNGLLQYKGTEPHAPAKVHRVLYQADLPRAVQ